MNNYEYLNPLINKEIQDIINKVNSCFGRYKKNNRIIKDDIFNILEMNCKTLYYPIEDDDICGFVYKFKEYNFCYINSYIPFEKQIFAAAHELYHILYSDIGNGEIVNSEVLDEKVPISMISKEDLKANRFAAEFLVPEEVFRNELNIRNINKDSIELREIIELMDAFLVPYKTLVRRLYEIGYMTIEKCNIFLLEEDRKEDTGVILWQKDSGYVKEIMKEPRNLSLINL